MPKLSSVDRLEGPQERKMGDTMDRLLTAARYGTPRGIATSTLYSWAAQGRIPHVRVNRLVRFPERVCDEWLRGQVRGGDAVKTEPAKGEPVA
jgi:excisionase family DNA binding protein